MELIDFAKQINLISMGSGTVEGDVYTLTIDNSDDYSKVYTLLDTSDILHLDTDTVKLSAQSSEMTYLSDDFDVTLKADFDKNQYSATITKVE
jgi:hypothetical protein